MADFCRQCIKEIFDINESDFAGNVNPGESTYVLCERCGWTLVDSEGTCVSTSHSHKSSVRIKVKI